MEEDISNQMGLDSIPPENRSPILKNFLEELVDEICRLEALDKLSFEPPYDLYGLVYPWVLPDELRTTETDAAKEVLSDLGFDGEYLKSVATEILAGDVHLKECCHDIAGFFRLIAIPLIRMVKDVGIFEKHFDEFATVVYSEPFAAASYSHVFNFTAFKDSLDFGDIQIEKRSREEIARLLGESTPQSTLHPYNAGEYFAVIKHTEPIESDFSWLAENHDLAETLVQLFQYYKDGIVHLNYTVLAFRPFWVNTIRKYGIFLHGAYRRFPYENGTSMYCLDQHEYEDVRTRWDLFTNPEIFEKFRGERNELGNRIGFAGSYYESSHTQGEADRRLIDLSIALEAAFAPQDSKTEISFQLAQLAAEFIGDSPAEKQSIFETVKKMYSKRSDLVHGNRKAFADGFVAMTELDKFSSIVRKGLLKFIALYIEGVEKHEEIIKKIRESLFDPEVRSQLKEQANIARLIQSRLPSVEREETSMPPGQAKDISPL